MLNVFVLLETEPQAAVAFVIRCDDFGGDVGGRAGMILEKDFCPDLCAFAGTHHRPPVVCGIFFEQQHFKFSAGLFVHTTEARGDDAGIVQHEDVAGAEMALKITEVFVRDAFRGAIQDEEPGGVAPFRRELRDEFRRERVVEVSRQHAENREEKVESRKQKSGAGKAAESRKGRDGSRGGPPAPGFLLSGFCFPPFPPALFPL